MTLKIAFVLPTIHVKAGGPPKVVFNICEGLSKIGYEIDVYCLSMIGKYGPIDITNNNKSINFKIFDASSLFCEKIGYCKKLVNSFHENIHNYDIVHIHCVWEHFLLKIARLCFKNNIPYVISPHGMLDNFELRKSAFQKKLWSNVFQLQKILIKASCLIYGTQEEIDNSIKTGLTLPETKIIANPVSYSDFELLCSAEKYADRQNLAKLFNEDSLEDNLVLTFFSRINYKKGLWDLCLSFLECLKRHNNIKLLIIGLRDDNDLELKIKDEIIPISSNNVVMRSDISGIQAKYLLASSDLFVLPSYQEGFSTAVVEAMSLQVPVLLSRNCNMSFLETLNAGIITDVDAKAISNGIDKFVGLSAVQRKGLADEAFDWITKNASPSSVACKLDELYNQKVKNYKLT